jgi:hypothetical protein
MADSLQNVVIEVHDSQDGGIPLHRTLARVESLHSLHALNPFPLSGIRVPPPASTEAPSKALWSWLCCRRALVPFIIDVHVHKVMQLFNSLDPAPFRERDMDNDAVEYVMFVFYLSFKFLSGTIRARLYPQGFGGAE